MHQPAALVALGLSVFMATGAAAQGEAPTTPDEAPAASPAEAERLRVLVLDLSDTGGLGADVVSTITGRIVVQLAEVSSLDIVSGDDVRRLAELEANRQTTGCDEASCLAELAGALGARYVVFGQAGKLGELLVLNLSLFDSEKAESVGRSTAEATNLESLPAAIGPALRKLLSGIVSEEDLAALPSEAPPLEARAEAGGGGLPIVPIVVAGAGGVLLVSGLAMVGGAFVPGVLVANAEGRFATDPDGAVDEAKALRSTWFDSGMVNIILYGGVGVAIVGLGALGGGAAWAALGSGE